MHFLWQKNPISLLVMQTHTDLSKKTRRACASERSCKIFVRVIVFVVPGGKQRPILLRRIRSKYYFVGFAQKSYFLGFAQNHTL